jgi:hypothetical protein
LKDNNNYNKKKNRNYNDNPFILTDPFVDVYASSLQFYSRLNRSFLDALFVPFTDAREEMRDKERSKRRKSTIILHQLL